MCNTSELTIGTTKQWKYNSSFSLVVLFTDSTLCSNGEKKLSVVSVIIAIVVVALCLINGVGINSSFLVHQVRSSCHLFLVFPLSLWCPCLQSLFFFLFFSWGWALSLHAGCGWQSYWCCFGMVCCPWFSFYICNFVRDGIHESHLSGERQEYLCLSSLMFFSLKSCCLIYAFMVYRHFTWGCSWYCGILV